MLRVKDLTSAEEDLSLVERIPGDTMQKILAIDDNMDNLVTLSAVLKNLLPDCTVIIAQSGLEGIAKAKAELPDTILLDVKMPGMDGFETCRRLMSDESTKNIPVIMITALIADPQSRIQGLDVGANAFLAKPIDETELITQVKVALRIKKAEDALQYERDSLEKTVQEKTSLLLQEIADRKRTGEALRHERWRLESIIEGTHVGTWEWNIQTGATVINDIWAQMLGYTHDELSPLSIKIWETFVHPDDLKTSRTLLKKHFVGDMPYYNSECRMKHKDGSWVWMHNCGKVISWTAEGKPLLMFGTNTDINERKQMVEVLKKRTHELGERVKELNCLYGLSEIVEACGDSLDVLIQGVANLLPQAWQYPHVACARITLNGRTSSTPNFKQTPWRQQHPINLRGTLIGSVEVCYLEAEPESDDGPFLRHEGLLLDIVAERVGKTAERIQARQALGESEEKHRRLFDTIIQGVVYQASDGQILSANPAAERILGLSLDQMLGKTSLDPGWRSIRENGSDLPGEERPAMVALRTGKLVERFIMGIINPQKSKYSMISVTATPLFQSGEAIPFQVYTTFDDITDYRRAEENFRLLFSEMLDGFALHEIICNDEGIPVDYRFIAVNPSFERMTGLKAGDITGKTVMVVMPATERYWIETYGKVALTGEPAYFQNYSAELQKHFEVTAFRPAPNQFACIFADITERKQTEESIKASLREKELLLKEIHHRVKNNLQIISSLLNLQAKAMKNEQLEGIFRECQDRITAMASVHQMLYKSQNFAEINFGEYLQETSSQLFRSYKTSSAVISLVIHAENVMLPIDTAIPCGLIINELITNTLKHAFPGARKGEIKIEMNRMENGIGLHYEDNGIGFPKHVDFCNAETLGLKLIHMLVKQLDGNIEQFINGGTKYALLLKPDEPQTAIGNG